MAHEWSDGAGELARVQDALLPGDVPLLPGLSVSARYLLAADDARAGGDWFDVVVLPDERVALVVGDVPGGGIGAAAEMARLQAVLHERLAAGSEAADAIASLDRFVEVNGESAGATIGVVVVAPTTGDLTYVLAGHPPPLVLEDDGGFRFLAPLGHRPLGTEGSYSAGRGRLAAGELLVCYTDGLVERHRRDHRSAPLELARVAAAHFADARQRRGGPQAIERAGASTLDELVRASGHRDDVIVLAAHCRPPPAPFDRRLRARREDVDAMVGRLGEWLAGLGTRVVDRVALLHAVEEVADNVVRHAYDAASRDAPGTLEVRASAGADGVLEVSVADRGRWREARSVSGRGLMVAGSLVDRLTVLRGEEGTTVVLRHRLTRPVELLTPGVPSPPAPEPAAITDNVDGLAVSGSLEGESGQELRGWLLRATAAGSRGLRLDLAGVSRLDGAAVAVLFEARERCARQGEALELTAPAGSPAQHVLATAGLPYRAGSGRS